MPASVPYLLFERSMKFSSSQEIYLSVGVLVTMSDVKAHMYDPISIFNIPNTHKGEQSSIRKRRLKDNLGPMNPYKYITSSSYNT